MNEVEEAAIETIPGAWASYDLAERELWDEFSADPTYQAGRIYLAGERHLRVRCERRIHAIRMHRYDSA